MADSFIQLPADSTGKSVDTRTESTNSEHREVHVTGDPSNNEGVAKVSNVDVTGEIYGLVVRDPNSTTIAANTALLGTGITVSSITGTTNAVYTRQANPAAVASDYVPLSADDLGRQITRPLQVRDLIATAYVSVATGTETTLLAAGGAGVFLDLIMLAASNNSTAATQLDIRAVTGGNIIHTMFLPPQTGPVGWSPPVPWPQDATNNNWTIDMPDQTGTTVYVSALFSKEV